MNIGFDLDGIFISLPPFIPKGLIYWLYKGHNNSTLFYRIPSKPEQFIRRISHASFFRPVATQNIQYIKNMRTNSNNKFFIISSRFSFLEDKTNKIIKKHGFSPLFDNMNFNFSDKQPHLFKNKIIKKLNIDLYVDDDLQLLEYLANENPKVKFFWLNNKENKTLRRNLFAIKYLSQMVT